MSTIVYTFCLGIFLFPASVLASFVDTDVTHPNFHAIEALQEEGIVKGYETEDGPVFRPLQAVIRAETVKVLMLGAELPLDKESSPFPDVFPDAWYAPYVNTAAKLNIVQGFADGAFHPASQVSRSEFLKMLVLTFVIPVREEEVGEEWHERFFYSASQYRIIDDPEESPYESISRGEMAEMMYRAQWVARNNFDRPYVYSGQGKASFYGDGFAGNRTASGETYDPQDLTAAHRTLPFGTYLRVSYGEKFVVVRINDRGPYHSDRVLDLSERAFGFLAPHSRGVIEVDFEVVSAAADDRPTIPEFLRASLSLQTQSAPPIPTVISEKVENKEKERTPTLPLFPETVSHLATDFFPNVFLRRTVPQKVLEGTVLQFSGRTLERGHKKVIVFFQKIMDDPAARPEQTYFKGEISGQNFSFPVFFLESGKYQMGVVLDKEKRSRVGEIEVLRAERDRKFPSSEVTFSSALNVRVVPEDKEAVFSWTMPEEALVRLDFSQNELTKTLWIEDTMTEVAVPYIFFSDFTTGQKLSIDLSFALSDDATIQNQTTNWKKTSFGDYELVPGFPDTESDKISVFHFPRFLKTLDPLVLEGKLLDRTITLPDNIFVIFPNGRVQEFPLEHAGAEGFRVRFPPDEWGTYVFEIVSTKGEILLNRALYFFPNFVLPVVSWPETKLTSGTISGIRQWTNELRSEHNLSPVGVDAELNDFAQNYAQQMVRSNFISHFNPAGEGLRERLKAAGFVGDFGENLSFASKLQEAVNGLAQSASHRKNILTRKWTRVGIGLAQNEKKEWYVVQIFGK